MAEPILPEEVVDRLIFAKDVLVLLEDTRLFGPLISQAIDDIDSLLIKARTLLEIEDTR